MRRLAILLSGRGSNFVAIADAIASGTIPNARIVAVISDIPAAEGLATARERRLPSFSVPRAPGMSRAEHESEILAILGSADPELVCLAGYMRILSREFVRAFRGRILNIHPSLLPKYPGLHPQRKALEAGESESGCTVHFVDEAVDSGPLVLQRRVPILADDTEVSLAARILAAEHLVYPAAIARVLADLPERA